MSTMTSAQAIQELRRRVGNIENGTTDLPSHNNSSVFGRNLIQSLFLNKTPNTTVNDAQNNGDNYFSGSTKEGTIYAWDYTLISHDNLMSILKPSTQYTIRYELEQVYDTDVPNLVSSDLGIRFYSEDESRSWTCFAENVETDTVGSMYIVEETFTTPEELPDDLEARFYSRHYDTNGGEPYGNDGYIIRNLKLEKGNKATDWTCAPEDTDQQIAELNAIVATKIDSVQMKEQIDDALTSSTKFASLSTTVTTKADASEVTAIDNRVSEVKQTVDEYSVKLASVTSTAEVASQKAGTSVKTITLHYLLSNDKTGITTETSGWSDEPLTVDSNHKYLWTYQTMTTVDGVSTDTKPVLTGTFGDKGEDGATGAGLKRLNTALRSYTYAKWSQLAELNHVTNWVTGDEYENSTINVGDTVYVVGLVSDKTNDEGEHLTAVLYGTVTEVNGENGSESITTKSSYWITDGTKGDTGAQGIGVVSITPLYYCSSYNEYPVAPTETVTENSLVVYEAWNKSLPNWTPAYCYYYSCYEVLYTDGEYKWTNVVRETALETANANAYEAITKYVEVTEKYNEMTSTVDGTVQRVGKLEAFQENLVVGATNLLTHSEYYDKSQDTFSQSTSATESSDETTSIATNADHAVIVTFPWLSVGDSYTFSFDYSRNNSPETLHTVIDGKDIVATTIQDEEYHRLVYTFTATETSTQAKLWLDGDGNVSLRQFQLEKGTIPTDWQPSPKDTQEDLDKLNTKLTIAETSISQNAEQIALRATKSEVEDVKTEAITAATEASAKDAQEKADKVLSDAKEYVERQGYLTVDSDAISGIVSRTEKTEEWQATFAVGAVNLLYFNSDLNELPTATSGDNWQLVDYGSVKSKRITSDVLEIVTDATSTQSGSAIRYLDTNKLLLNKSYTFAIDIRKVNHSNDIGTLSVCYKGEHGTNYWDNVIDNAVSWKETVVDDKFTRYHVTFTLVDTDETDIYFVIDCGAGNASTILLRRMQLEEGTVPTTWSYAPEEESKGITDKINATNTALGNLSDRVSKTENWQDSFSIGGRNYVIQNTLTKGKYLNESGIEVNNEEWCYTDYIATEPDEKWITSGYTNLGKAPSVVYYDSNKNIVSGIKNDGVAATAKQTIPSGVYFFRYSIFAKDLNTIKLEKGTVATDWSPAPEDTQSYADDLADELKSQIDAKINTFYQSEDPSKSWDDTEKQSAVGDIWHNTTDNKTYRWNGTTWDEIDGVPSDVYDAINGKKTVFYSNTAPTENVSERDLWVKGNVTPSELYIYDGSNWVQVGDYSDAIDALESALEDQQKAQINTYYQATTPTDAKSGDLWYDSKNAKTYRYDGTNWQEIQAVPKSLYDTVDKKKTVFYQNEAPTSGMANNDIWIDSDDEYKTIYVYSNKTWVPVTQGITSLATEIGSLTIGGSNLWIETALTPDTLTQGSETTIGWSNATDVKANSVNEVITIPGNSEMLGQYFEVTAGEIYTITCEAKLATARDGAKLYWEPNKLKKESHAFNKSLTTEYQRFVCKWACSVSGLELANILTNNSHDTVSIRHIQVERGTIVSDWKENVSDTTSYTDNLVANLQSQLDKKVNTYSQSTDPSTAWTTDDIKTEHSGDIWYKTDTGITYEYKNNAWIQIDNVASELFDKWDSKKTVYYSVNAPEGDIEDNDIWIKENTEPLEMYVYNGATWDIVNDYSGVIDDVEDSLQSQIDNKIATYYGETAPTSPDSGDIWYDSKSAKTFRYNGTEWQEIQAVPSSLYETLDGKKQIFYQKTAPTTGMESNDLWVDSDDAKRTIYIYNGSVWVVANDYSADLQALSNSISNIKVGGRNYFDWQGIQGKAGVTYDDSCYSISGKVVTLYNRFGNGQLLLETSFPGILSMDAVCWTTDSSYVGKNALSIYFKKTDESSTYKRFNNYVLEENKAFIHYEFPITEDIYKVYLSYGTQSANCFAEIKNIKYEKGTIATDWTPNPDDTKDYIDNLVSNLSEQVDNRIETYCQSTDPSTAWSNDTLESHDKDLWYNTETGITYEYNYNAETKWKVVDDVQSELFDKWDGKKKVFYQADEPATDVDDGDLWVESDVTPLQMWVYVSSKSKWEKVSDYSSELQKLQTDIGTLTTTVSGKISTYYGETTPSNASVGDIWYNSKDKKTYRYGGTSSGWQEIDAISSSLYDELDGKKNTYYQATAPTTDLEQGDYWVDSSSSNPVNTYIYDGSKWVLLSDNTSQIENALKDYARTSEVASAIDDEFKNFIDNTYNNDLSNLQNQIDGAIQFWNGEPIPTLSNYPANEWKTEEQRVNHQADIYTVIVDADGELKQAKSYRFDKVGDTWQWLELTDNELSAVQALAMSKSKVYYATTAPTKDVSENDVWIDSDDPNKQSYIYVNNKWVKSNDYQVGGRNYFIRSQINNLALTGTSIVKRDDYRSYYFKVNEGEVWTIHRTDTTNNRWRLAWCTTEPVVNGTVGANAFDHNSQAAYVNNTVTVPKGITWAFLYLSNQGDEIPNIMIEKGNVATDWTPAPEDTESYIDDLVLDLQNQIDNKIETWWQDDNPSTAWTTTELKTAHTGDYWYCSKESDTTYGLRAWKWTGTQWTKVDDSVKSIMDTADGKSTIYYATTAPTSGMQTGDYWVDSDATGKPMYIYSGSAWVRAGDPSTEIANAIADIQIGGRNYLQANKCKSSYNIKTTESFTLRAHADTILDTANILSFLKPNTTYTFSYTATMLERTEVPTYHSGNVGFFYVPHLPLPHQEYCIENGAISPSIIQLVIHSIIHLLLLLLLLYLTIMCYLLTPDVGLQMVPRL